MAMRVSRSGCFKARGEGETFVDKGASESRQKRGIKRRESKGRGRRGDETVGEGS